MRKIVKTLGLLAVLLGLSVLGANVASATTPTPTPYAKTSGIKVVEWKTSLAKGIKSGADVHSAADVTWPQTLYTGSPTCGGFWLQVDNYTYNARTKTAVDALIKHGTLNEPGSKDWTDTAFVNNWKVVYVAPCASSTLPSSSTATSTPPVSTPPVTTTAPPTLQVTPTPSLVAKVTPQLPNTGLPFNPLYLVGLATLLLLAGIPLANRKRKVREH